MNRIDHILFPTDLSAAADAALAHAAFLAEALGARLVLFHVAGIPVSEYAEWGAGKEEGVWQRVDAAARRTCSAAPKGWARRARSSCAMTPRPRACSSICPSWTRSTARGRGWW